MLIWRSVYHNQPEPSILQGPYKFYIIEGFILGTYKKLGSGWLRYPQPRIASGDLRPCRLQAGASSRKKRDQGFRPLRSTLAAGLHVGLVVAAFMKGLNFGFIYIHMYMYVSIYIYTYVYIYIYMCMCVYIHAFYLECIYTCTCTHMCI